MGSYGNVMGSCAPAELGQIGNNFAASESESLPLLEMKLSESQGEGGAEVTCTMYQYATADRCFCRSVHWHA